MVVKDIAVGAGGLGFDFWADQIGHSVATAAMFLGSCAAQALSLGNGSLHLQYRKNNEDCEFFEQSHIYYIEI